MHKSLPERANLEHLRKQGKDLLRAHRSRDPKSLARIIEHFPKLANATLESALEYTFTRQDALLVVAREHGFANWTELKNEVERRSLTLAEKAEQFVLAVCQCRIERARQLLNDTPGIADASFHAALSLGNVASVKRALEADAKLANSPGGPEKLWYPLHYVANSGFHKVSPEFADGLEATTKLLLESGADPNAAWVADPWPDSPIRPLYYATGVSNNVRIAKLLIDAGAELNDGESIYHSAEHYHIESLELLRDAGADLGSKPILPWGNTPLYFLCGFKNTSPSSVTSEKGAHWLLENGADPNVKIHYDGETALHWAVRNMRSIGFITNLLEAGADPNLQRNDGKSAYDLAIRFGDTATIAILEKHGANTRELTIKEQFLSACMGADRAAAVSISKQHPNLISELDEEEHYLIVEAAIENRVESVRLMLDVGFDIAFKGTKEWNATALHCAGWHGNADTCLLLLERGAPIEAKANPPETSYPLGWAIHGSGNCRNPKGDYPRIVEALIQAGAKPSKEQICMASEEVADLLSRYLPVE